MKRNLIVTLTTLTGVFFVGVAIFATQIGLDNNTNWEKGRFLALVLGSVITLVSPVLFLIPNSVLATVHNIITTGRKNFSQLILNSPIKNSSAESKLRIMNLLAILTILFSLIIYTWYISVGRWTNWPTTTNYYDQLASSFQHGKLWLEQQPSPGLLALPDPYDYTARKSANVSFLWDTSLYKGKYFLYWGPMPAIILAGIKIIFPISIGDQYLTFGFLGGMLIFTVLLIIKLWRRFFQDVPIYLVLTSILLAALVSPVPWMLNRAAIYEATITGGQFFLITGMYFAYSALEGQSTSKLKLLLAVTLWTCAAWSRTSDIISASFLTFLVCLWVVKDYKGTGKIIKLAQESIIFGFPLGLGTVGLGWYNWARFGSVFETGLRYTLTFINLNSINEKPFSLSYVLSNLWMYLFNLPKIQHIFPFILPTDGQTPFFLGAFGSHHAEEITGLIFSAPIVIFAIIPVFRNVTLLTKSYFKKHEGENRGDAELLLWVSISLMGASLLPLLIVLLYFNITMRFFAEFMPSLTLLSVLGLWQGYNYLRQKSLGQFLFSSFFMLLAILSIAISLLLAMTGYYNTFQQLNTHLFKLFVQFFNH